MKAAIPNWRLNDGSGGFSVDKLKDTFTDVSTRYFSHCQLCSFRVILGLDTLAKSSLVAIHGIGIYFL